MIIVFSSAKTEIELCSKSRGKKVNFQSSLRIRSNDSWNYKSFPYFSARAINFAAGVLLCCALFLDYSTLRQKSVLGRVSVWRIALQSGLQHGPNDLIFCVRREKEEEKYLKFHGMWKKREGENEKYSRNAHTTHESKIIEVCDDRREKLVFIEGSQRASSYDRRSWKFMWENEEEEEEKISWIFLC